MKWWMERREGDELRYVPLSFLRKVHAEIHAFGVEKGGVRVGFDRGLAKRGQPAFFRQRIGQSWEYFAR